MWEIIAGCASVRLWWWLIRRQTRAWGLPSVLSINALDRRGVSPVVVLGSLLVYTVLIYLAIAVVAIFWMFFFVQLFGVIAIPTEEIVANHGFASLFARVAVVAIWCALLCPLVFVLLLSWRRVSWMCWVIAGGLLSCLVGAIWFPDQLLGLGQGLSRVIANVVYRDMFLIWGQLFY